MNREVHVRNCDGLGVQFPGSTPVSLDSLLLHDHIAPAVPLGHPFSAVRQSIKNFLALPHRCAPDRDRVLHNSLCL
jgi:hypothetical protein